MADPEDLLVQFLSLLCKLRSREEILDPPMACMVLFGGIFRKPELLMLNITDVMFYV